MANQRFRWRWVLLVAVIVAAIFFVRWNRSRTVRVVQMVEVERKDIHTGVVTNGKAETIEYREVRAEIDGEVVRL